MRFVTNQLFFNGEDLFLWFDDNEKSEIYINLLLNNIEIIPASFNKTPYKAIKVHLQNKSLVNLSKKRLSVEVIAKNAIFYGII